MTGTSPDLIKDPKIHQQLNEKQLSYDELFHHVDKNNDGKIDVNELIELLEKVDVETSSKNRVAIAHVSSYNKSPVSGRMLKPDVFAITNSLLGVCIGHAY
jgi:hypothetical protein